MREYLEKKGFKFKQAGTEAVTNCMFCEDKKQRFYVNQEKSIFYCHNCSEAGNLWKLKKHFGELNINSIIKPQATKKPQANKDTDLVKTLSEAQEAVKYLKMQRGFTSDTIKRFNLGYDGEYISIPYYQNKELVNIKYQSIKEKRFKREEGCASTLFNIDNVDYKKDIILCEGENDCIAAVQLGFENVTSVPTGAGSFNNEWIDYFDSCAGNFYICYDNDPAGEQGAEKLSNRIGIERCYRVSLPAKDFNDCLMAGFSKNDIQEYFDKATQYRLSNVKHLSETLEQVEELWREGEKGKGLQLTNWSKVNEKLGGLRPAEITVITGDSGSGKSTISLNFVIDLIAQDKGILIASTEMQVRKVVSKLFTMHAQKPFENLTTEEYEKCVEYFSIKNIFFIDVHGHLSIEHIDNCMSYVKRKYGVEYVVLDHLHFFLENEGSDRTTAEINNFMKKLVIITLKTSQHAILIAHPAKLNNQEGKVKMNDIRGSSSIKQMSHNVATVWRNRETEEYGNSKQVTNEVVIDFEKVRDDSGTGGKIILYFDYKAQTYKDLPS